MSGAFQRLFRLNVWKSEETCWDAQQVAPYSTGFVLLFSHYSRHKPDPATYLTLPFLALLAVKVCVEHCPSFASLPFLPPDSRRRFCWPLRQPWTAQQYKFLETGVFNVLGQFSSACKARYSCSQKLRVAIYFPALPQCRNRTFFFRLAGVSAAFVEAILASSLRRQEE